MLGDVRGVAKWRRPLGVRCPECLVLRCVAMTKRLQDEQFVIRVAAVLKAEVQAFAEAEGRTASDYIKRVLIGHVIERTAAPAELVWGLGERLQQLVAVEHFEHRSHLISKITASTNTMRTAMSVHMNAAPV
jgi:hypothetical protein